MKKLHLTQFFKEDFSIMFNLSFYSFLNLEFISTSTLNKELYPLHWRMNNTNSLLQIEITQKEGILKSLSIPLYKEKFDEISKVDYELIDKLNYLPIFEKLHWKLTDNYSDTFIDIKSEFNIEIGTKNMRIILFKDKVTKGYKIFENIIIEFNQHNELISFYIDNISAKNQKLIKEYRSKFN